MGVADRDYEYKESFRSRFTLGARGNALVALVTVNIIFFLFILTANLFNVYSHQGMGMEVLNFNAVRWFALPASFAELAQKPWTILTFMFSHGGGTGAFALLLNMLGSMLWLWLFGFILQDLSGNKYIFPVYIYGGIAGAIFFIAGANFMQAGPQNLSGYFLAGSGVGTMAVAAAVTAFNPDYRVFRNIRNGMPIWILSAIYLLINLPGIFTGNIPHSVAYIGAALAGFLFVYSLRRGRDGSLWMTRVYDWAGNLFNPLKRSTRTSIPAREKIFYNTGNREPFTRSAIITQKRVDEILDKINLRGYDLLTEEEKNVLKKAAEKDDL